MTVNLALASPSMDITCYFANIHRILVKVEQRFFHRQMTLGHIRLLTASDGRSYLTVTPLASPTEGRDGRIRMCLTSLSV